MKSIIKSYVCMVVLVLIIASNAIAGKTVVNPAKIAGISDPQVSEDTRLLLFFELPSEVMNPKEIVDFALLKCKAEVSGSFAGQIEIFPVTTQWADRSDISWNDPWEVSGGDYSSEYMTSNFLLKSSVGEKGISIDVTEIVRDWQSGNMSNRGVILKLSGDDLSDSQARCQVDESDIELEIYYSSIMKDRE